MHQLYISYALQAGGFGSAAVAKAEEAASQKGMNGTMMVLYTMAEECQMHPEFLANMFTSKGRPAPKVSFCLPSLKRLPIACQTLMPMTWL